MGDLDGDSAQPVSGTVTDADGNAISGATVSDGAGNSTTTASDGSYTLDLQDGTYTLTASKSGYVSKSQTVTVSGSPVTGINFSLGGNLQGTVTKKEGGACAGCTVELWLMNDTNTTTDAGQTIEEAQEDTVETLSRAVPRDLYDPEQDLLNADRYTGENAGNQVLVHSTDAWYEEADPIGPYQPTVGHAGTRDLGNPIHQLDPDTEYTFSIWDRTRDPIPEDGVDSKVEPGVSSFGTIVIERVGPGNSTISKQEIETSPQVRTGFGFISKKHEYATASLPEGYYKIYPKTGGVPTYYRVGQPEQIPRTIEPDLQDAENRTAAIAQEVLDKIDAGAMKRVTVQTDAKGRFGYAVPDGYSTVSVSVFDGRGLLSGINDPSLQDLRQQIKTQDYNGSIYMSTSPKIVHPPDQNVNITVVELTNPTLSDLAGYFDQLAWLENLVNKEAFAEVQSLFTDPLSSDSTSELLESRNRLRDTILGNSELRSTWEEIAAERGVPTDLYDDSLSRAQLQQQIEAMLAATSRDQTTVDGQPGPGTGSTTPEWGTSPNAGGGTTINIEIPTGSQLNETDGSQSVVCQQPDGSTRWVNATNVSIDSGMTGDTILVEDVLGNETAGCNYVAVAPGEDGGAVREEVNVENPGFDGTIPALSSINVNTMRPGPDETVVVGASPAETSSFKSLHGAEVYGPDGNSLPTSMQNGKVHFTTSGSGSHLVKLNVTDGQRSYIESFRVKAGNSSVDYPASIRVHNGVLGRSVVASDGVKSGRITTENGGAVARITAEVDGESVPGSMHVHARDLTGLQQEVTVAVVKSSDGSQVTKPVQLKIHLARLSSGAHVRANGNPITDEATRYGKVQHFSDSTLVTTNLEDGSADVSVNNSPGVLDQISWWVDLRLQDLPGSTVVVDVELVEVGSIADVATSIQVGPVDQLLVTIEAVDVGPLVELAEVSTSAAGPDPATAGLPQGVIA